jgi:hypothetical protein
MPFKDLTGQKFGKWTVIEKHGVYKDGKYKWLCKCDCGTIAPVFSSNLLRSISTSCGCYGRNILGKATRQHGMTKTRMYKIWVGIRKRCYNPKMKSYADYGGRGIKVCDKWNTAFINFYNDMKEGYADNLSLEREDPNGHYEKSNCRWATATEQARNKRDSRFIECDGSKRTLAEWEDVSGTGRSTISWRIKNGWPIQRAIYGDPVTRLEEIKQYLVF